MGSQRLKNNKLKQGSHPPPSSSKEHSPQAAFKQHLSQIYENEHLFRCFGGQHLPFPWAVSSSVSLSGAPAFLPTPRGWHLPAQMHAGSTLSWAKFNPMGMLWLRSSRWNLRVCISAKLPTKDRAAAQRTKYLCHRKLWAHVIHELQHS